MIYTKKYVLGVIFYIKNNILLSLVEIDDLGWLSEICYPWPEMTHTDVISIIVELQYNTQA